MDLSGIYQNASPVAAVIISVAVMLFAGFAMTRITNLLHLPNVTAYIVAGILLGPFCLHLVPDNVIEGMDFLSDIALAFIAFSTGEFFKLETLKRNGMKVVLVTVAEALMASVFVFIMAYFVLGIDLAFSIVLAALASATAPASTMMTIRQTRREGRFRRHAFAGGRAGRRGGADRVFDRHCRGAGFGDGSMSVGHIAAHCAQSGRRWCWAACSAGF